MDPAIKRGFAIGFVCVAVVAGLLAWRQNMLPDLSEKHVSAPPIPAEIAPRAPVKPAAPDAPAPEGRTEAAPAQPQAEPPAARADRSPSAPGDVAVSPPAGAPRPPSAVDVQKGAFDVVRVEPSGEAVVAGRCAAGCTVELTSNGRTQETVKADAAGNFVMTPPPLAPGEHELGLRITTADGRVSTSEQTVTVSVPKKGSRDVVVVLNEPDGPSKILQKPGEAPAAAAAGDKTTVAARSPDAAPAGRVTIGAIDAERGRFFVQGVAPAGARLRVYLNNAPVAEPVAGPDERWSVRIERGLMSGRYVVRIDQLDRSGKVASRAEQSFVYEPEVAAASIAPDRAVAPGATPAPSTPAAPTPAGQQANAVRGAEPAAPADTPTAAEGESPHDRQAAAAPAAPDAANPVVSSIDTAQVARGDSLWRISRRIYGRGMRYTTIFTANDGQIRNPNLIYPGQVLVLPADGASAQNGAAAR